MDKNADAHVRPRRAVQEMVTRARRLKRDFFGIFLNEERVVMWPWTFRKIGMNSMKLMNNMMETGASIAYLKITPVTIQLERKYKFENLKNVKIFSLIPIQYVLGWRFKFSCDEYYLRVIWAELKTYKTEWRFYKIFKHNKTRNISRRRRRKLLSMGELYLMHLHDILRVTHPSLMFGQISIMTKLLDKKICSG